MCSEKCRIDLEETEVEVETDEEVEVEEASSIEKLKSRKLWVTVLGAALLSLSDQLGIDHGTGEQIVALIAAYVLGEAAVDFKRQ